MQFVLNVMEKDKEEFRFEWFSGTGKGGQHRNKHQNCCRCIHIQTGITAISQASRSREDNMQQAYLTCKSRVKAYYHRDKERCLAGTERIRTYHEPNNTVTDHASNETTSYRNMDLDRLVMSRAKAIRNNE